MCGIVGVFERDGAPVDLDRVATLRDVMTHRGPDDAGLWRREPLGDVAFGSRRLAIVDLSEAGRQPMASEDGLVHVAFNGEIYNHEPLRTELERRGHRFRSRCDTEVLVHLYEEYGAAMVDRLVGMFALAIWDERRERLFLSRDRLGIKPLYWIDDGRRFAFASEIKSLLPVLARREIDPVALRQYLTFVTVPPPRTLFAGVNKLPPACTLIVERHGAGEPDRYWDPIAASADYDGEQIDWESELRFRLERSVQRRLMSDVPVGVFLSGGVDSSTNVALMSRLTNEPVNTFTVGFRRREDLNEFVWARRVAEQFGSRHQEIELDASDLWSFLPELVHHQDEPIADPVCVPLHFVSRLAKESGVTVVHVGEGADELFAGYPTYVRADAFARGLWRRLRRLPPPLRRLVARGGEAALASIPRLEIHREALRRSADPEGHLWWGGAVAFYEHALDRLTTPALVRDAGSERPRDVVAAIAADAARAGARDELDAIIYQDLRLRLPELLLMRVDKLTMANSVEARVPFLDHELVELAMAIPHAEKIRAGVGKQVLKRAVADLLPAELVWRPKQGFATPVSEWFRVELATSLEQRLRNSAVHDLGYLDRGRIDELVELHRSGRADRGFQLWNLLNLAVWFDHWIAQRDVGEPAAVAVS
jgi:asparagine synthase (glutamine-hydrolysing)